MENEGPLLESLTRRLADCPAEFLLEPRVGDQGTIDIAALVCDLARAMQAVPPTRIAVAPLGIATDAVDVNRLKLIAVAVWLLNDPWFLARPELSAKTQTLLSQGFDRIARVVKAETAVADPDRREELARLCLHGLGLRPLGETAAQAADRLTSLDSVERDRVIRQMRDSEARAREVREMMARRAAEEAAAKASRE
jgi:hypothetical protein